MSVNPYQRLDQFLNRNCCPGCCKTLARQIHRKGSIIMDEFHYMNANDAKPLRELGVIQRQEGKVTLTEFAQNMIDEITPR